MSDRFGLKVKENAGKTKYSSLNLNQTYKGTKVETKTSSGLYLYYNCRLNSLIPTSLHPLELGIHSYVQRRLGAISAFL